jgi:hypothetical protein
MLHLIPVPVQQGLGAEMGAEEKLGREPESGPEKASEKDPDRNLADRLPKSNP